MTALRRWVDEQAVALRDEPRLLSLQHPAWATRVCVQRLASGPLAASCMPESGVVWRIGPDSEIARRRKMDPVSALQTRPGRRASGCAWLGSKPTTSTYPPAAIGHSV